MLKRKGHLVLEQVNNDVESAKDKAAEPSLRIARMLSRMVAEQDSHDDDEDAVVY